MAEFGPLSGRVTQDELFKIARIRERFLADPTTDLTGVRPMIARSWYRSNAAGALATSRHDVFEESRVDEQTMKISSTVLAELKRMAQDAGGYVTIVAPSGGLVDDTGEGPPGLFGPGYVLREEYCGTNGDGTALEEGHGLWIHSKEHYRDDMQETSCYSALVRDPYSRHVRACIGLTLPESVAMETDARAAAMTVDGYATAISRELAARASLREQTLFREYLKARRIHGNPAVIAIDGKTNIMSDGVMEILGQGDYGVIASYAHDAVLARTSGQHEVMLSGDRSFRLEITPAGVSEEPVGAIVLLRPAEPGGRRKLTSLSRHTRGAGPAAKTEPRFDRPPGIVGTSPAFEHLCRSVAVAVEHRASVHLVGEGGVGKSAFADVIAGRLSEDTTCVDATATAPETVLSEITAAVQRGDSIVLRRVDALAADTVRALGKLFADREHAPVVLTLRRPSTVVAQLIAELGSSEIAIPPLRMRRDDIPPLVHHFLAQVTDKLPSPRLLAALTQADWPGNLPQLRSVVRDAASKAQGVNVSLGDLPQGFQRVAAPGRLSRLEEAEMHELRAALEEANGNRSLAAEILQIGRSTLYRRLSFYQRHGIQI